jgi:RNA polymerase sigma factor (sigma-70 family)
MTTTEMVELFERCNRCLLARLGKRFGDRVAEDAVAEAWLIAWRNRGRLDVEYAERWLAVVARHEAYRLLDQQAKTVPALYDQAGEHAYDLDDRLTAREHLRVIAGMRPQRRTALLGRALGFSYRDIAQATGHTYTWVNRHVTEGRAELREGSA